MDDFADKLGERTRMVACAFVSNVLGTVLPVEEIIARAHAQGALVLLDASQAVTHRRVDVHALDVDFLAWTGHKLYGPTGIGVLYCKYELLDAMPPFQGGGDMIDTVSFAGTTFREPPFRFEAGTPAIVEAVGLGAAVDWVEGVGIEAIAAHEADLLDYAMERLGASNDVRVFGTAPEKVSVLAFALGDHHANDVGTILDRTGVALRVGQYSGEPPPTTGRALNREASFAAYNGRDDVDALLDGLAGVRCCWDERARRQDPCHFVPDPGVTMDPAAGVRVGEGTACIAEAGEPLPTGASLARRLAWLPRCRPSTTRKSRSISRSGRSAASARSRPGTSRSI